MLLETIQALTQNPFRVIERAVRVGLRTQVLGPQAPQYAPVLPQPVAGQGSRGGALNEAQNPYYGHNLNVGNFHPLDPDTFGETLEHLVQPYGGRVIGLVPEADPAGDCYALHVPEEHHQKFADAVHQLHPQTRVSKHLGNRQWHVYEDRNPESYKGWMSPDGDPHIFSPNAEHYSNHHPKSGIGNVYRTSYGAAAPPPEGGFDSLITAQKKGFTRFGVHQVAGRQEAYIHFDGSNLKGRRSALHALRYMKADKVSVCKTPGLRPAGNEEDWDLSPSQAAQYIRESVEEGQRPAGQTWSKSTKPVFKYWYNHDTQKLHSVPTTGHHIDFAANNPHKLHLDKEQQEANDSIWYTQHTDFEPQVVHSSVLKNNTRITVIPRSKGDGFVDMHHHSLDSKHLEHAQDALQKMNIPMSWDVEHSFGDSQRSISSTVTDTMNAKHFKDLTFGSDLNYLFLRRGFQQTEAQDDRAIYSYYDHPKAGLVYQRGEYGHKDLRDYHAIEPETPRGYFVVNHSKRRTSIIPQPVQGVTHAADTHDRLRSEFGLTRLYRKVE